MTLCKGRGILVVGATSEIAQAVCRHIAQPGDRFALTARDDSHLRALKDTLEDGGADPIHLAALDMHDVEGCKRVVAWADDACSGLDLVFLAPGLLPDQSRLEAQPEELVDCFQVNALGPAVILLEASRLFEERGAGTLAALSSVAGDRGRPKNYVYGAAKSALDTLLEGLELRLRRSFVRVINIKPGPVRTRMTSHLPPSPLLASPERVGRSIARRLFGRSGVAYVPWYWRQIMWIVRSLPRSVLARLKGL